MNILLWLAVIWTIGGMAMDAWENYKGMHL